MRFDGFLSTLEVLPVGWIFQESSQDDTKLVDRFNVNHSRYFHEVAVAISIHVVIDHRNATGDGPADSGRDRGDVEIRKRDQLGRPHRRYLHGPRLVRAQDVRAQARVRPHDHVGAIPQIRAHYDQFGDKLPATLSLALDELEGKLASA